MIKAMDLTDQKLQEILEIKDYLSRKIEEYEVEIELLKKNLSVLDSIIKQSSFTKASTLRSANLDTDSIPIKKGSNGEVIANAYITPDQVSIILNENLGVGPETPPFKSFFIDRIIEEMKRKDSLEAENGKIKPESIIDYVVNKKGSEIREIIIKNYRQKDRLKEIINTAGWSLTRMLENIKK